MKTHIVLKIARQIEGEFIFINALKAFSDKDKAKLWMLGNKIAPEEVIEGVHCIVEVGLIEDIEIEL
jgi:hypothetical protein